MQWNRKWRWLWFGLIAAMVAYNLVSLQRSKTLGRALEIAGLGRELEERGDLDAALQKYQEALNLQPRFPYGLALLGKAYHKLGEDDKALASYERALQASPRHFWVHYLIGQLYRDQGRYHEAIRKFNELAGMEDNWYSSNKVLGYVQYQALAYGELGHCYAKIWDRQKALEAYEQYLTLNPSAMDRKEVEQYVQQLRGGQQ